MKNSSSNENNHENWDMTPRKIESWNQTYRAARRDLVAAFGFEVTRRLERLLSVERRDDTERLLLLEERARRRRRLGSLAVETERERERELWARTDLLKRFRFVNLLSLSSITFPSCDHFLLRTELNALNSTDDVMTNERLTNGFGDHGSWTQILHYGCGYDGKSRKNHERPNELNDGLYDLQWPSFLE
ncbi:hypothetical protein GCK72_010203 [Caenorhabditis remanei]|uniref:Uncharacterized protein n=1 Tax=Caenorhabditis remanei TaxID=31234 RepID=A0A6A5H5C6_CAERE|nr:hypothetical protein GCK72_010203 [Caenorhabditis remanei]KAF1761944.1 hypothetical protein GCK72_010203 [Caenorhabditis remanei]